MPNIFERPRKIGERRRIRVKEMTFSISEELNPGKSSLVIEGIK